MHVHLLIALAALLAGPGVEGPLHDFHATNGRMAVEGRMALCEIRFFKHDLEDALAKYHDRPGFRLAAGSLEDSLFVTYLDAKLEIKLNATIVRANLTGSGEEVVRDEEMWWYRFSYSAAGTVTSLDVRSRLLFELFDDQRNILKVQHFPSEQSDTFYFVPDSDRRIVEFSTG